MQASELIEMAERHWSTSEDWWKRAAYQAMKRGHYTLIDSPHDHSIYLARFWISPPVADERRHLQAEKSVMLHYFLRPDHDRAAHCHPWWFRTTILSGGYQEQLPPRDWDPKSNLGPVMGRRAVWHRVGQTVEHEATDLHYVGKLLPETWTMVVTGPEVRRWGFHPAGQKFVLASTYLGYIHASEREAALKLKLKLKKLRPALAKMSSPRKAKKG